MRTVGTQTKLEFPYTVSGSPKESDGYVKVKYKFANYTLEMVTVLRGKGMIK